MTDLTYDPKTNKGVMFFSAGTPKDVLLLRDAGIKEVLVSHFYIKKRKKVFEEQILPDLFSKPDELFMVDSGGSTFIVNFVTHNTTPEMFKEAYWIAYIENYVQWLHDFKKYIFVAANVDLEMYVGNKVVDKWNKKYFEPLEKHMQICYVAHEDMSGKGIDPTGIRRITQYLNEHEYVGISGVKVMKDQHKKIFAYAAIKKRRLHGFGWTSIPVLKSSPFFSVDSTTWKGGSLYGTTYLYDGKNFVVKDFKNKHVRKTKKLLCLEKGIEYDKLHLRRYDKKIVTEVPKESSYAIDSLNLQGWLGARKEYLRSANIKLKNKPVIYYAKS